MIRVILRNAVPVITVSALLALTAAVLVALTIFFGQRSAQGGDARYALGVILIAALPLNLATLLFVARTAAAFPDHVMDERVQQFILSTLASIVFALVGSYEITPWLPLGLANFLLVFGVVLYMAKPILFLRVYWGAFRRMRE